MDLPGQAVGGRGVRRSPRLSGVCLATCAALPAGDPEIAGRFAFDVAAWDDPSVDWSAWDLVVIRSTWDWSGRAAEYLGWVHSLPRVANAADVVEWNHDKQYLRALQAAGIPVVPTRWDPTELPPGRWVVKPTVSAGARTTVVGDADDALAHVAWIHRLGKRAMVQPYVDGIDEHGETALVYLGGELSHAARKNAVLGHLRRDDGTYEPDHVTPRTPSPAELEVAEAVLDMIPFDRRELLYARVDLIPDSDGDPLVLELELIEPSLFLDMAPGAADRFVEAVLSRV